MTASLKRFDVFFTEKIQAFPKRLRPIMKVASFFGEPVIGGILLLFATYIAIMQKQPEAVQALITAFVVLPVASVVKLFVKRTRPITYVPTTRLKSHSFPSGHSYGSFLGTATLAWIVCSALPISLGVLVAGFAIFAILLVGISRIYLGAHFPSDVVGGWMMASIVFVVVLKTSGLI